MSSTSSNIATVVVTVLMWPVVALAFQPLLLGPFTAMGASPEMIRLIELLPYLPFIILGGLLALALGLVALLIGVREASRWQDHTTHPLSFTGLHEGVFVLFGRPLVRVQAEWV
jgi:hypothetical protein